MALFAFQAGAGAQTPVIRTIDSTGDVGAQASITVVNGRLAVSYADDTNLRLKLWYDDGRGGGTAGDMIANGTEIRTVDSTRNVTSSGSAVGEIYNFNGRLAIAYCDTATFDVILWVDDGAGGGTADDAVANGSEIRVIDTASNVGVYVAITSLNGKLAVAYDDLANQLLKLWYDDGRGGGTAGDGQANGTEIQTIASLDAQELAMTVVNGRLAIAFQDFNPQDLMLWYDDGAGGGTADDVTANGSEVRTVSSDHPTGFFNAITSYGNHVGVSFYHFPDDSFRFWLDDGNGGGIADNGIADGTEIRVIEDPAIGGGLYPSITTIQNRLAISSWGNPPDGLRVWYDDGDGGGTAGDVAANGTELRQFPSTDSAYFSALTSVGSHILATAYYDGNSFDLKLAILEVPAPPNAPGSLGPAGLVNGSPTLSASPALQFTQTDPNSADTLSFQIQIDDTSSFASPVVDYTSTAIAQGITTFTVGQAAGSGGYSVGSVSQTLAAGSYYWRVRTSDGTDTSAWTTANSGSIAFVVVFAPTVTTNDPSSVSEGGATCGGNVTSAGTSAVTARGVCWSTAHSPTTSNGHTTDGTGTGGFSSNISGLLDGTKYYIRAYATNSDGTAYGSEVRLTTLTIESSDGDSTASELEDEMDNSNTPPVLCGFGSLFGIVGSFAGLVLLSHRRRRDGHWVG